MHAVEINNLTHQAFDEQRLASALSLVLHDAGYTRAEVSIAIVDDDAMRAMNRDYLQHDYATDVLSFRLDDEDAGDQLEGEIIVSADTARRQAASYGWSTDDELLLYVIHGALHLAGYDDQEDADRQRMREAEQRFLSQLGIGAVRW